MSVRALSSLFVLDETDVLLWWGHAEHDQVLDETVTRVQQRVIASGNRWVQPPSQVTVKPRHVPVEQAREMIQVRGGTVH
jgi:trehalose utilization protein